MNNQKNAHMADRDINVESVKEKASALMVGVNQVAKTAKVVKSVNIIERDMIVKTVEEKASALTRDRELSVKIAEGRRSVHTADRSQDVKIVTQHNQHNNFTSTLSFHNLVEL